MWTFFQENKLLHGKMLESPANHIPIRYVTRNRIRVRHPSVSFDFDKRRIVAEDADEKWSRLVSKSEKPRTLNLQLHTRVYLLSYVRYLCRTKSHLCRSQNKLLIIEIRRISRRYVNGLHTVDEARRNHTSSYLLLLAEEALGFCNAIWIVVGGFR